jgi:peptidoglycan/xylan/chitin deacetylase (PgdA/CDA1 family)
VKAAVKTWLKRRMLHSGALTVVARVLPPAAVILMYHSIVEEPELTRDTIRVSQSKRNFEAHMQMLAERFTPVTVQDVAYFASEGRPLPRRAVAVTFDDGFADNYHEVLPVLARFGIPATFYIMVNAVDDGTLPWYCRMNFAFRTTRRTAWTDLEHGQDYPLNSAQDRQAALKAAWSIGARKTGGTQEQFLRHVETSLDVKPPANRVMLTWDEVRAMRKAGHIIGGHTLSHPNLAHVSEAEARSEIEGCKRRLEEELGEPVNHFSYPHPALDPCWSSQTVKITSEAGFQSAALTYCGPVRRGENPLSLKRIYAANDLAQWMWNIESTFLGRHV